MYYFRETLSPSRISINSEVFFDNDECDRIKIDTLT